MLLDHVGCPSSLPKLAVAMYYMAAAVLAIECHRSATNMKLTNHNAAGEAGTSHNHECIEVVSPMNAAK